MEQSTVPPEPGAESPSGSAPAEPATAASPAAEPVTAATPAAEPLLLDEPTTSDLAVKVKQAWQEFARALAGALITLAEGHRLDITLDPTASGTGDAVYATTVLAGPSGALEAYAVGTAALPAAYRMKREAVADLIALGWSPPGVVPGSGEHFGLTTGTGDAATLATILTRTMRDVFGAPHPAFIVYLGRDREDQPVSIPQLGTARAETPDAGDDDDDVVLGHGLRGGDDGEHLAEKVKLVVAGLLKTDPDELPVDSDGDIGIRAGSAMVFVRTRTDPPLVDVFSPVLTEVEPTEQLYVKLSELTNRMPIGRLYCANDTVWASIPVFGRSFQTVHLTLAIQVMTGLADELDDRLHGEFGGKRFFGEGDKAAPRKDGERTGMYL